MNENLKEVLQQMIFMSDQQVLSDDFKKINFKKNGWWRKYTWTAKTEERFIEWLIEHLKKNWQGLVDTKPINKNQREKIANEFVGNYGCVTRPLNIDDFTPLVPEGQIKEMMSKEELDKWNNWARGNTMSLHGVYRWDLESFLRGERNWD